MVKGILHVYKNSKHVQKAAQAGKRLIHFLFFILYILVFTALVLSVLQDIMIIPALAEKNRDFQQWIDQWKTTPVETRIGMIIFLQHISSWAHIVFGKYDDN